MSCNNKKESSGVYKKPAPEKLDAICTWLGEEKNFLKPNYKSVLYTYYNNKIKEQNYLNAAKTLEVAAWNTASYLSFDQHFFQTITSFSNQFRGKIPENKSRFIDMYFGDYYTDKGELNKAIDAYSKNTNIEVVDYNTCYLNADSYRTIAWCYNLFGRYIFD